MKNETIGLERLEISELVRELRNEKGILQDDLYAGLCKKKVYFQLEHGEVLMDELLSERLFSRLHVQYRWLDIMLSDANFWQKECRYEINLQIHKRCWEKAEELLEEYAQKATQSDIHKQYVLAKRAEICFQTEQQCAGELFREALEMTMPEEEVERRLDNGGVVSEEELWMYFRYRSCENPFSVEEYQFFLKHIEEWFLTSQIYTELYFEVAYQFARMLCETKEYELCREVCKGAVLWLKRGIKNYHAAEFHFLDAISGMKLSHDNEEERELYQQCKMAYYVSSAFGEKDTADKIKEYCREELKWHITA